MREYFFASSWSIHSFSCSFADFVKFATPPKKFREYIIMFTFNLPHTPTMKKIFSLLVSTLIFCQYSFAQQSNSTDPVMLTIAGENVTRSEFEKVFLKNNRDEKKDQKALEEYLNLFINYKLKVKEARDLGLDTIKNFRDELSGYRKQLAQPYLT